LNNIASAFPTTIVDQDLLNNTSTTETPVVSEQADLIITSELDQHCLDPNSGNKINLTVSNVGNLDLVYGSRSQNNKLTVSTTLPAGVTLANSSHSGWDRTNNGQTYIFTRNSGGTLRSGRSLAPISYTLTSNNGYTNTVHVASTAEPSENQNNNSSTSTVDATPNPPIIPNSTIYYCLGETATELTATATAGHTLYWYLNPGGASSTTPFTPQTTTTGTTTYYVSQKGPGGCESDLAAIEVIVSEETTSGEIFGSQLICRDTEPEIITSTTPGTGDGTITYRWESSIDQGATWSEVAGATGANYQPGNITQTTAFRRISVATGNTTCESEASNVVTITTKNCLLITNPHIYQKITND